jgi:hypothetical protein
MGSFASRSSAAIVCFPIAYIGISILILRGTILDGIIHSDTGCIRISCSRLACPGGSGCFSGVACCAKAHNHNLRLR